VADERTTVFIIDDDSLVRRGLSRQLRAVGMNVEAYGSAKEFLDRKYYDGCGCILLDVNMPGMDGMELQEKLVKADYVMPIIFISGHGDVLMTARAMKKGAVDFLTKPVDMEILVKTVKESLSTDRENRKAISHKAEVRNLIEKLTPREYEILRFVITGIPNKQIAYKLGIAEHTVKIHRGRMMRKMNVESVVELVRSSEISGVKPAKSDNQ